MTNEKLAHNLRIARTQQAKIKVIMAAHPDNAIIQGFGCFMWNTWEWAINRAIARHA